jgi:hypothetical protein
MNNRFNIIVSAVLLTTVLSCSYIQANSAAVAGDTTPRHHSKTLKRKSNGHASKAKKSKRAKVATRPAPEVMLQGASNGPCECPTPAPDVMLEGTNDESWIDRLIDESRSVETGPGI